MKGFGNCKGGEGICIKSFRRISLLLNEDYEYNRVYVLTYVKFLLTFDITTFCTDSEGEDIYNETFNLQLSELTQEEISFVYLNPPPTEVQLSSQSEFELQHTTGNLNDRAALTWNVQPFGAATLNHLDRFRTAVTFHTPGEVNISVNIRKICTEEIETITATSSYKLT